MMAVKVPQFGIYLPAMSRGTADALAATTGLSMADARMALTSPIPRRVATAVTEQESEGLAASLRRAGFDAFAVSFDALRARPPRAKTAQLVGTAVEFQPGGSFPIRLVVRGQLESVHRYRSDVMIDGGAARNSRVDDARQDPEPFVCFFGDRVEQAVEIRPYTFNFRFLGSEVGISKAQSLKAFLDRIHGLYPTMRIDDTLVRFPLPFEYTDSGASIESVFVGGDTISASSSLQALVLGSGSVASSHKSEGTEKAALRCAFLIATAALHR